MIPKIIHYCWYGGAPIPDEYASYIGKWKKLNPDFKIMKWDESNSPLNISYIATAIKHKNWANVSNLVRFIALEKFGGVYLDTDMMLIKSLKPLLNDKCFLGFEEASDTTQSFWVNNAIIGSEAKHPFIKQCISAITSEFDGTESANLSAPHIVTKVLKDKYGLKKYGKQVLKKSVTLYPIDFFYPIHYNEAYKLKDFKKNISENTIGVHMWARTWLSNKTLLNNIDELRKWSNDLQKHIIELKKDNDYERSLNLQKDTAISDQIKKIEQLNSSNSNFAKNEQLHLQTIKDLNGMVDELRKWSSDLQIHISELKKDNDYERAVSKDKINTIEGLRKELLEASFLNNTLRQETEKHLKLEQLYQNSKKWSKDLQQEIESLKKDIDEAKNLNIRQKLELDHTIKELAQVNSANHLLEEKEKKSLLEVEQLRHALTNSTQSELELKDKIIALNNEQINTLKKHNDDLGKIAELERSNIYYSEKITQLQSELAELKLTNTNYIQETETQKKKIAEELNKSLAKEKLLSDEIRNQKSDIEKHTHTQLKLEAKIAELTNANESNIAEINKLRQANQNVLLEKRVLETELKNNKDAFEELNTERALLRQQLTEVYAIADSNSKGIINLLSLVHEKDEALTSTENTIETLKNKEQELLVTIHELTNEKRNAVTEADLLKKELESIKAQLKNLNSDHQRLVENYIHSSLFAVIRKKLSKTPL